MDNGRESKKDLRNQHAEVAELVDALVSKTSGRIARAGSIPAFGTNKMTHSTRLRV